MSREFIHMVLSGPTASYRLPTSISGTQLALETPSYSAILGMLSYLAGREIKPDDTSIGFRYEYLGSGMDLETIHRWKQRDTGSYTYTDTAIRRRQIHYHIRLEIILDNTDLIDELRSPSRQPTFGRSQDLARLESINIVTAKDTSSGSLMGTLLPINNEREIPCNGIFYNLPEYFEYKNGKIRKARNVRLFLSLDQKDRKVDFPNIWRINNQTDFYLHMWSN